MSFGIFRNHKLAVQNFSICLRKFSKTGSSLTFAVLEFFTFKFPQCRCASIPVMSDGISPTDNSIALLARAGFWHRRRNISPKPPDKFSLRKSLA